MLRLAHDGAGGGAQRRDAALQVRRQPHPELVREPHAADLADRVPLRLPALLRGGAEAHAVRAEHQRLPLRHRDHHPAAARRTAHRRAPDPDLLRRRDLPRERPEIRLGRRQVGAEDARPGARPSLRSALRHRLGRGRQRAVPPQVRLRQPACLRAADDPGRRPRPRSRLRRRLHGRAAEAGEELQRRRRRRPPGPLARLSRRLPPARFERRPAGHSARRTSTTSSCWT